MRASTNSRHVRNRGHATVEFLLVLALVALAGIVAVSRFGQRGRGTMARSVAALEGQRMASPEGTPSDSATNQGDAGMEPGRAGNGKDSSAGTPPGEPISDDIARKFWDKVRTGFVEAAFEDYDIRVRRILEEAADGLGLSVAQHEEMMRRAAREFALHGEEGAINALEALQDVRATLHRGEYASKTLAAFEIFEKGSKVFDVAGAIPDLLEFSSAMRDAVDDPAHQHEHEGEAIGIAAGAVGGAALITVTAPVSVPMLVVGVFGAAVIGILAKPAVGWIGRQFDEAKAARKVIRVR